MSRNLVLLGILLLSSCALQKKVEEAPPPPEFESRVRAAEALYSKACYVPLKQAFQIYSELYAQPRFKKRIAARFAMTSLLLAVREKELGMASRVFMDKALELIKENPSLNGLVPYAEIAGLFWVQGKGVMRDVDERFPWKETEEKLKKMEGELLKRAGADEFAAYMYAILKCFFSYPYEKKDEPGEFSSIFPDSLLLKYKSATCPEENEVTLKEIIRQEPQFYEASYDLGNLSLSRGDLLEAEGYFFKAFEGIPDCPQTTILLASISLALEEVERSLEFYEKTLAIAPEYRDALLGKAICLSYLERHDEAIATAEKIIGLGYWLLGESYYWVAWNQHELKKNEEAAAMIEQAKGRLPTESKVFTLSAIIAVERGELAKAESDFKEALQYNPANSEALFNLASLYARKQDWQSSGVYFEKAGLAFENEEKSLRTKISQVERSALLLERKERLLRKKTDLLAKTLVSKATSFYNAAAGYLNAGQKHKALEMATRASEHPALKQKADELASQLKPLP